MSEPKDPSDDASKGTGTQATTAPYANPTSTNDPQANSKPDPPENPNKPTPEPEDGGEHNGTSPTPAMEEKAMTMLERYAKTVTSHKHPFASGTAAIDGIIEHAEHKEHNRKCSLTGSSPVFDRDREHGSGSPSKGARPGQISTKRRHRWPGVRSNVPSCARSRA